MAKIGSAKIKRAIVEIRDFLDEKTIGTANRGQLSRMHRFAHFWLMVVKSFSRNRGPIRAAALTYTTLLALIPMVAVALSVSTSILRQEGRDRQVQTRVSEFIDKLVENITPPTAPATNAPSGTVPADESKAPLSNGTNGTAASAPADDTRYVAARQQVADTINGFIKKTNSRTVGSVGMVLLIFTAISMLRGIEATFNDIWGVEKGRGWLHSIVQYWAVITLAPVLALVALGLANKPHLQFTQTLLDDLPSFLVGVTAHSLAVLSGIVPILFLSGSFALFYMYIPHTRVHWQAAVIGGLVGGLLWHLNNVISVLYVSRWVTNSKIYGSLAAIPVIMVGLYFSWLILLFGAQVAYGWQNRRSYIQDKQAENINQRGREFIALRLMECVGQRFLRGERPATVPEMADALVVPGRLVQQIMQTLLTAGLLVEVAGQETAYSPARALESINCHHILLALRAGQGEELATRDDPARAEVFGEFEKILEAERKAASGVTVLAMVNRTEKLTALAGRRTEVLPEGKHEPPAESGTI
jgi:membrane protein